MTQRLSDDQYLSFLTIYRNALHQIPESGFEEFKTSQYIQSVLKELGIPFEVVVKTGVIAYLEGKNATKTLGFRSDMDGLSVAEKSNHYVHSSHAGYMHACGHDGHMSMLLGLATYLKHHEDQLVDNIVLIFQPAEEGPGGAEEIVKEGYLSKYKVDEMYGIHLYPAVPEGKYGLAAGPMMAMTGEFDVDIIAKSAHGAMPHEGIDAIVIASECVSAFQNIVSRNVSPIEPAVLTVGRIEGGERRNVIAGSARLEGTIRAFNKNVHHMIKERIRTYLDGIEKAYNIEVKTYFRDMYPPVINPKTLVDDFVSAQGRDNCVMMNPQMISEDFSFYQEAIPALFYFVGTYNESENHIFPLHSAYFNFNHRVLRNGLESYIRILNLKGSLTTEE
jgi:amidohydrolase